MVIVFRSLYLAALIAAIVHGNLQSGSWQGKSLHATIALVSLLKEIVLRDGLVGHEVLHRGSLVEIGRWLYVLRHIKIFIEINILI